ncbi:TRIM9_67 [Mytilus edulis]|uniref:TRIM9_67 n=1 Tax=Mytilus edulis TaxID=6550 RepID=A0A8S3T6N3_MYTED|nr:TRIM9_67 [Mytilus edulis]
MAQSASKSCDICMSGPGRNYCQQCDQWMCGSCKTLHLRSKISRNHCFLSESKCGPKDKPLCKEHDENFIFYCIDCEIPIYKIEQGTEKYKSDIKEAIRSITEDGKQIKQWIDQKVRALITSLEEKETENLKTIHLIRTGLKDDLDKFQKSHFAFTETQKIADATKLLNQFKRLQFDLDVSGERKSPVIPTIKYNKRIYQNEKYSLYLETFLHSKLVKLVL